MLEQDVYCERDPAEIRRIVTDNPWATMVTSTGSDLAVSHLPVLLEDTEQLTLLGHLPVDDARQHALGQSESVFVFQAEHGYVSASWYEASPYVPTWNYVVVHAHGRAELLGPQETLHVLRLTTDRFEPAAGGEWRLEDVEDYARRLLPAVVGFRLAPRRLVAKTKLSQDKPAGVVDRVVAALESDGPYRNDRLAAAMRRAAASPADGTAGA